MTQILPARRLLLLCSLLLSLVLVSGCAVTKPVARVEASSLAVALASSKSAAEPAPSAPAPARRGQVGIASFYGGAFHGRPTASGETFDQTRLTAAHPSLEFGTRVRVTNLENRRAVVVTVNDRGPFVRGRVIDLSTRAARALGFIEEGTARVRIQRI